jgi:hypothetical protein
VYAGIGNSTSSSPKGAPFNARRPNLPRGVSCADFRHALSGMFTVTARGAADSNCAEKAQQSQSATQEPRGLPSDNHIGLHYQEQDVNRPHSSGELSLYCTLLYSLSRSTRSVGLQGPVRPSESIRF